ncbi:MAG: efflux RND transporter permease subunit [Lachnospiraceae bacterium]|nr:efflux RND transporter permease subunit [Lachnospiraceae bacterium]
MEEQQAMISKFSVKRPFTVVVAVVMVLILGYVSFTRMTTDLLPSMELPYAIVLTTYPGASPEEVEGTVTIPIEESMATINNIEKVSSVSNENYSMVILEFGEDTNMDSASLDMRESLDQLEATWTDEMIGSPIIMKLNPDMMPIMIAGVEDEKYDNPAELTTFVEEKILPELQSVEGVASVSASGELEQSIQVILRQEKIDALNKKIHKSLDGKFADAEKEISDAQKKLDDGKDKLESTQKNLGKQKSTMSEQLGNAQGEISSKQSELLKTQVDLENQLKEAEKGLKELQTQKAELTAQKKELEAQLTTLKALPAQLQTVNEAVKKLEEAEDQLYTAKDTLKELNQTKKDLEAQLAQAEAAGQTELVAQLKEGLKQTEAGIKQIETGLSALGMTSFTDNEIDKKINELSTQKSELKSTQKELQSAVDSMDENEAAIHTGISKIDEGISQLDAGIKQLTDAKKQLSAALSQVEAGKTSLSSALSELNAKSISGTIDMAVGTAQVNAGLTQTESGQKELDKAKDEIKDGKKTAYDSSDMNEIVTLDMIRQLLTAQSFSMPAGYVTEEGIDYLIRVGDKVTDEKGLKNLVLMDLHMDGIKPVKLSDVADVVVTDNSDEVYANINGHAGIAFTMEKQTGYSTGDVCDNILERFERLESENEGLHFITLMDQGVYIDMIVDSVLKNLMYGAILAIFILLLFLKDFRPTLVVACSIPISILTCVVLMYFSGITLNIISLSGLALGVGMLVDNSIVVIENIYRMRKEGVPAKQAAIEGARQVSGAIIASTLTTVCVFAPIVFTEGLTRQLFVDMGLTIAYSLLASLIVALTLVPMLSSRLLRRSKEKPQPFLERVQEIYGVMIGWCLRFKPIVLIASVGLLVLSGVLAISRGTALIPEMDSTQATITISVEKGKSLTELGKMADEVTERLLKIKDVRDIGTLAGSSGGSVSMNSLKGQSSENSASMYLILNEDTEMNGDELTKEIEKRTSDLDCTVEVNTATMDMSALSSGGISIRVEGRDLDKLKSSAQEIAAILEKVEGTQNVSDGIEETTPELRLTVDRKKAMAYGLTTAQVYQAVAEQMKEPSSSMTLSTDTYDYDVYVIDGDREELTRDKIKKMKITGTNKDKKEVEVPISKLVTFKEAEGLNSISRADQTRYLNVTAEIAEGHNIGLVANDVNKVMKDYKIAPGCSWEMAGEDETINEAFEQIGLMLVLALAFMYLIMVAQFQSLLSPFIIMFTIPLAFTGGLFGLWVSGSEISMIALIGFVMLSGIIVNNGIVMVDYINQLRYAGCDKKEAIAEAGMTRLRPILMTALTTILAMSTMMFSDDMGAAMGRPMAIVTVGGLLYGTLLTLFVVPCVYDLFNRKKEIKDPLAEDDDFDDF